MNIGVGAHITAASTGGPRYDAELTPAERKSIENGVWLCQSCGKLVDNDPSHYTAQVLRQWKQRGEDAARSALEQGNPPQTPEERAELRAHRRQLIASWRDAIEVEKYEYIDYRSTFLSSAAYSSLRQHLLPEVVKKVEAPRTIYVGSGRGDFVRKQMLLDEVARIEKVWQLV